MSTRRLFVVALGRITRRWPGCHPATSVAYRVGLAFADATSPVPAVARLQTGSTIVLDLTDLGHRHIHIYGSVEDATTRLVHRLARPGWCVLDVGANAGYYALTCADLGGKSSDVHAFEPQPALAAALRDSVARNDAPVTVVEAACGAHNGEAVLYESRERNWASMATLRWHYFSVSDVARNVKLIRLDTYCELHNLDVDLVKIDVEGHEADVLAGLERTLRRSRPHVVCETRVHDGRSRALFRRLDRLGYRAARIAEDGSTMHAFTPEPGDDLLNLYFAPSSGSAGEGHA